MTLTFLDKEKIPFDTTPLGIVTNTITGLPKAALQVGKDIGQGIARSIGSSALTLAKPFGGEEELTYNNIKSLFGQELFKNVFGDQPVKAIENRVADAELKIKESPFAKNLGIDKYALPLAFTGIMGTTALDLTPFGGLEKNAAKSILRETTEAGALKIARSLGADETIAKQIAPIFASTKTEKEAEKSLELFKGLLGAKQLAKKEVARFDTTEPILMQEARKYKNAEEFVKAQESMPVNEVGFHGTQAKEIRGIPNKTKGTMGNAFYLADSPEAALNFGTDKSVKIGGNKMRVSGAYQKANKFTFDLSGLKIKRFKNDAEFFDFVKDPDIEKWFRLAGYDGAYITRNGNYAIYNTEKLKLIPTKSQLTDIWKEANKEIKTSHEDIFDKQLEVSILEDVIDNHPAKNLTKYVSKTTGRLPEVTGKETMSSLTGSGKVVKNSEFGVKGDDIITEYGYKNLDEAQASVDEYRKLKQQYNELKLVTNPKKVESKLVEPKLEEPPVSEVKKTEVPAMTQGEARSLEESAQKILSETSLAENSKPFSLPQSIRALATPVKNKVNLIDYIRTPDRVLAKIGLKDEADFIRNQYDNYVKELPKNIEIISQWSKEVPKESNKRIFKWLDGKAIDLNQQELKVGNEIKEWLKSWAERLGLPEDNRIAEYITHIFDDQLIAKEFDEDLAKIIADKIPGSIYSPFLLKRLGAKGYIEDTWKALEAYIKRATRKVNLDPALERIKDKAASFEKSQWDYVKSYLDRVNLRPTNLDTLIDNGIKSLIGYRFGQRPLATISQFLRQMTYRSMLGLNLSSALKNISQGINTYAKLGEKYTVLGYLKLFSSGANKELMEQGVLKQAFIQDKVLSATRKTIEKIDKGLFSFFDLAEKINRGSAYFGAKAKALAQGKTELEAVEFAKKIVRDTQFTFGSIDTPQILQSDIGKTLGQFQSFTVKQIEFLTEMAMKKEFVGLIRYAVGGLAFVYSIGKAFGMEPKDLIPAWRIGEPASLKFPIELTRAILNTPNKYGQSRDLKTKISDIGKSLIGLIPAGTQIKKTIQGMEAVKAGKSTTKSGATQFKVGGSSTKNLQAVLFGKYANPEAKAYFKPTKKSSTLTW